jgi:hypothetical protein
VPIFVASALFVYARKFSNNDPPIIFQCLCLSLVVLF